MTLRTCRRKMLSMCRCPMLLLLMTPHNCLGFSSRPSFARVEYAFQSHRNSHPTQSSLPGRRISQTRISQKRGPHFPPLSVARNDASPEELPVREKIASFLADFKVGALLVHNNFLNLFWTIQSRTVLAVLAFDLLLILSVAVSPALGSGLIRVLTRGFLGVAKVTGVFWTYMLAIPIWISVLLLILPAMPVKFLPESPIKEMVKKIYIQPLGDFFKGLEQLAERWQLSYEAKAQQTAVHVAMSNLPLFAFRAIISAPLVEELIYRKFLMVSLKRLWKKGDESDNNVDEKQGSNTIDGHSVLGYTPWALVSSIAFALNHIGNWVGPLRGLTFVDDRSYGIATALMTVALMQFLVTLQCSLRVFTPAFEKDGLPAAIGAHAMWNLSIATLFIGLPIRLSRRLWIRLSEDRSKFISKSVE